MKGKPKKEAVSQGNYVKGSAHPQYTHGLYNTPLYKKWMAMKRRCTNKHERSYKDYGGRGITVCDEWIDFTGFYNDMHEGYEQGLSLERIDNDKGYFKGNCKWITMAEQARNKRSVTLYEYKGEKLTTAELGKKYGIFAATIRNRIVKLGWSVEKATETKPSYNTQKYKKL